MNTSPVCLSCGEKDLMKWASTKDTEYLSSDQFYTYYRCKHCHALSIHPVPREQIGLIYPHNYYSYRNANKGLVYKVKEFLDRRFFKKVLKGISGTDLNVLDVGGGRGWVLTMVKKSDHRVKNTQIVEIGSEAGVEARKAGHSYFGGGIENFKTDMRFDLILMLSVIEHVDNPVTILQKAGKLLRPGGRILIQTPNYDTLDARLFRHSFWGGYHCPRHWVLFQQESLIDICQRAGLSVVEFKYTQGAIFWSWSVISLLSQKGWLRVTPERSATDHPLMPILNVFFAGLEFLRLPFCKTSQVHLILSVEHNEGEVPK